MDTTDLGSLLTSPFHFLPVILLLVPVYLVKAWELQKEECLQFLKRGTKFKKHVHLTQNCDYYQHSDSIVGKTKVDRLDVALLLMNIVPIFACFIIGVHLFCFRNKFYLIERFGKSHSHHK